MQRDHKWKNWPVLLGAAVFVVIIVITAINLDTHKTISNYLADVAGAITAVILSIATYDEWERRRERKRYLPPEKMGVARIQEEINQLLYQYAFVLNLRFNPDSLAMRTVERATRSRELTKPDNELKAKSAKYISQSDPKLNKNLFELSAQALKKPAVNKQTYGDINQLILQTERTIGQLDLAISTYGYSFTPEVHKWSLDVRESVSQAITGKIPVLSIRLAAASKAIDDKLDKLAAEGVREIIDDLLSAGRKAKEVKLEDQA